MYQELGVTAPPTATPWWETAIRLLAAGFGLAITLMWLFLIAMVADTRFDTNPANDPHGYGLIFGSIISVPLGFVAALIIPLALPRGRRAVGLSISMLGFLIGSAAVMTMWFPA